MKIHEIQMKSMYINTDSILYIYSQNKFTFNLNMPLYKCQRFILSHGGAVIEGELIEVKEKVIQLKNWRIF